MITWYQLARMDLRGRDAVIQSPYGFVRGPLCEIRIVGWDLYLEFQWLALQLPSGEWKDAGSVTVSWRLNSLQTLPFCQDDVHDVIEFQVSRKGFGKGCILPEGCNMSSSKVPGLDLILEISDEIYIEDLPDVPVTTDDEVLED